MTSSHCCAGGVVAADETFEFEVTFDEGGEGGEAGAEKSVSEKGR